MGCSCPKMGVTVVNPGNLGIAELIRQQPYMHLVTALIIREIRCLIVLLERLVERFKSINLHMQSKFP